MSIQPRPTMMMTPALWGMLIALSIVWGGSFFFNGVLVRELPPLTIVFLRVLLAAVTLHLWLIARGQPLRASRAIWLAFFGMGLLNNAIPFTLIVFGQTQIASGVASILNATTPLFTLMVAHLATDDEKIGAAKASGILVGFAGVFIMLGGAEISGAQAPVWPYLACLGAALSYGCAGVFGRRFRRLGVVPKHVATGQLTASGLLMAPLALVVDQPWTLAAPSMSAIASIIGLAVLCTALAYILFFAILSGAGATNISLVTFLVPVSAIMLGIGFLGETLEARHFAGMAMIAIGLALVDGKLLSRKPA
jgi:drug/metabolite transporter (DMT)-like permease